MPKPGAPKRALHLRRHRIVPSIRISDELAADIGAIAFKAFLREHEPRKDDDTYLPEQDIFIHTTASLAAEKAINHFLEEKGYEVPLPKLRELTKADSRLANSVRKLLEHLPEDGSAPFAQMRALYCYGKSAPERLDDPKDELEDVWKTRLSAAAVKAVLAQWLSLMEELHKQVSAGRSPASLAALEEGEFKIPLPKLQELTEPDSRLAKSIRRMIERLPEDEIAPFAQMRSLYCYGDAESEGLDSDDPEEQILPGEESAPFAQMHPDSANSGGPACLEDQRKIIWETRLSAAAVKTSLAQWLILLGELHKQTGTGRSPISVQFGFVRTLAAYWTDTLKAPLSLSRTATQSPRLGGRLGDNGQRGPFAQFVYKAAEGIPEEFGRHSEWDAAIRETSEKKG
jgi:hypothetical protein